MPDAIDPKVAADIAAMTLQLAKDPKTRKRTQKLLKEAFPNYNLPADIAQEDLTESIQAQFAERDRKEQETAVRQRLESQRRGLIEGTLIKGRQFDEETVKTKIEPFMQEKGIADYDDGARLYMAHQPPVDQRPEIPTAGQWTMPKVENPFDSTAITNAARGRAFDVIREINAARR